MSHEDTLFDQQIHDAYESVTLSEEAQDRILAKLLSAEAAQAEPEVELAPVIPFRPRRSKWRVALPVAAALLVVAVVVRVGLTPTKNAAEMAPVSVAADGTVDEAKGVALQADEYAVDDQVAMNAADEEAPEAAAPEAYAVESASDSAASQDPVWAEVYPLVTLGDGTQLTTMADGQGIAEVDADKVGDLVAVASAYTADASGELDCEVYRLAAGEGYAVRYPGEDAYWLCALV